MAGIWAELQDSTVWTETDMMETTASAMFHWVSHLSLLLYRAVCWENTGSSIKKLNFMQHSPEHPVSLWNQPVVSHCSRSTSTLNRTLLTMYHNAEQEYVLTLWSFPNFSQQLVIMVARGPLWLWVNRIEWNVKNSLIYVLIPSDSDRTWAHCQNPPALFPAVNFHTAFWERVFWGSVLSSADQACQWTTINPCPPAYYSFKYQVKRERDGRGWGGTWPTWSLSLSLSLTHIHTKLSAMYPVFLVCHCL